MTDISLQQLLEAGAHFGHQARRWNPAMQKYIFDRRDGVHIFDLEKTKAGLDAACAFVKQTTLSGGKVLFVATKRQAAGFMKEAAIKTGQPYVTLRWLGGTLTNFEQISKRINRMKTLKAQRESGELKKYTKYEQLQFDREILKLERFLGGISDMVKLQDAVFVMDTHTEEVAVLEAKRMKIPVVGVVDTNGEPSLVDYVIPANDDAVKSIELIVNAISGSIASPKSESPNPKQAEENKPKKAKKAKKAVKEANES